MTDIDEGNPWPNHGAKWTVYHYRAIIAGLRERRGWREISREIGRTEAATRSRAGYLIDDDGRRGTAATRLRARLEEDPEHDWETIARRRHFEAELPYWDEPAEALLRARWEASQPSRGWRRWNRPHPPTGMSELVTALKASEADIADRIVELGLSTSYAEIADRLGCVPGGALDQRARRARADDEAASYVLVAAGEFGQILHASLHPDRDDAEDARATVERRYLRHGPVTTKIVRRVPGRRFGGDIDDDAHDHNASPAISAPELGAVPEAIVDLDKETPAAAPTPAANPAPRPLPRIRRYHHSPAPPPLPRSVIDAHET